MSKRAKAFKTLAALPQARAPLPAPAPVKAKPYEERALSLPPHEEGILLTLSPDGDLLAQLPSGHFIALPPSADQPARFAATLRYMLRQQARVGRAELRHQKLAESAVPTVHYLEPWTKHVEPEIPIKDPKCPFCRASEVNPQRYAPQGEAAKLSRETTRRARRAHVISEDEAEDLGI